MIPFTHEACIVRNGEEIFLTVEYVIHGKWVPEKRYLSNGDIGYEAEYPELEILGPHDSYQSPLDLTKEELLDVTKEIWKIYED